jgi:PhnB protein
VPDVDALYNRAVSAGAKIGSGPMGPLADQFWGDRTGTVIDPEGFQWTLATRKEDLSHEEMDTRMKEWMKNFAPQPAHS